MNIDKGLDRSEGNTLEKLHCLLKQLDAASWWAGWALAHPELTLFQLEGQIITTALLLAHPDLKTYRHLCIVNQPPVLLLMHDM